jgi:hypothetical protein
MRDSLGKRGCRSVLLPDTTHRSHRGNEHGPSNRCKHLHSYRSQMKTACFAALGVKLESFPTVTETWLCERFGMQPFSSLLILV